jgi:hypothetical protein
LAKSLTFNSTLGLNWSDAYIGQIVTGEKTLSKPPHFGVGISAGATTVNKNKFLDALEKAGVDSSDFDDLPLIPLPAAAAELRIGGFILPFDIGVKAGVVPFLTVSDMNFKYTFAGFDIRYALIREEIKGWKPSLSVGAGFNYIQGEIDGVALGDDMSWNLGAGLGSINMTAPSLNIHWNNMTLDLKAQVSKRLIYVFTPYLGLGTSFGWSTVGYGINSKIGYTGAGNLQDVLNGLGIPMEVDGLGISGEEKMFTVGLRAYGGLAINMWKIILDFTGMYSFLDNNYGVGVGFRVQI